MTAGIREATGDVVRPVQVRAAVTAAGADAGLSRRRDTPSEDAPATATEAAAVDFGSSQRAFWPSRAGLMMSYA
uniref:Uncharacterized protein n=1 Tax=Streptomyces sp. NBC_00003 TaxID=2903608 RepID=A0AAU2VGE5_9ACTN